MAFLVFILLVVIIGGIVVLAMNKDNGSDRIVFPFLEKETSENKKSSKAKSNIFVSYINDLFKEIKEYFEDFFYMGDGDELKKVIDEYEQSMPVSNKNDTSKSNTFGIHALAGDEDEENEDEENEDEVINDEEIINVTKASGDQVFKLGTHMFFVNYNSFIMDSRFVDLSNPVHKTWSDGSKMDIYIKGNKVIIEYHHNGVVDRKGVIYYI